jgi:monooxygenase
VRELAGITSDTWPATAAAMSAVVRLSAGAEPPALEYGWHRTPRGWIVVSEVPGGAHVRALDPSGPHPARERPPTAEDFRAEVARIAGREVPFGPIGEVARFSDFSRLAHDYRRGRVLLAGDAAHVLFPIGGQGLTTGVLDALSLGWRLAHAVRCARRPESLDPYEEERRPAAERVIGDARAQVDLMRASADAGAESGAGLSAAQLVERDAGRGRLAARVSGQDTVAPPQAVHASPAEGRFLTNVPLLPLEDSATDDGALPAATTDVISLLRAGRPLLLLGGADGEQHRSQAEPWAGLLRVVRTAVAPTVAPFSEPMSAVLVRPDGYIAWTPGAGGLAAALTAYFGAPCPDGMPRRSPGPADSAAEALPDDEDTAPAEIAEPETVRPAPAESEIAYPAPVHPAPVHPAPAEPKIAHPAPLHPAPVHPAPVHPAPVHPAPVHPAPARPAPAKPPTAKPSTAKPSTAEPSTAATAGRAQQVAAPGAPEGLSSRCPRT